MKRREGGKKGREREGGKKRERREKEGGERERERERVSICVRIQKVYTYLQILKDIK